jgi:hypothetical protein
MAQDYVEMAMLFDGVGIATSMFLYKSTVSDNCTNILYLHVLPIHAWQPSLAHGITVKMYNVDFSPTVFFSSHFAYQTLSSLEPKIAKYYNFVASQF